MRLRGSSVHLPDRTIQGLKVKLYKKSSLINQDILIFNHLRELSKKRKKNNMLIFLNKIFLNIFFTSIAHISPYVMHGLKVKPRIVNKNSCDIKTFNLLCPNWR